VLIKDCRLADKGNQRFDVRISGERVSAIAERINSESNEQVIQANGALLTSSLTEPHSHLDKALLAERIPNLTGDLMGAIRAMDLNRRLITVADTIERAERAVRLMVRHGVTAIRSHVDVKVDNGMDSIEALLDVRARTSDIVDIQICAMLDWPLSGDIGKQHLALGRNAIRLGADLIGGCPHLDENSFEANIALIELAGDLGCGIDLHTDEHTDVSRVSLEDLAERVIATGFENSVTASHCVSLGMQSYANQQRISELVAKAKIGVVALPHTNLFLQGRDQQAATPRGLTAITALRKAGVLVAAGADNLQDPFNPIGRGDPLESAALLILTAHQLPQDAFDAVTCVARKVIGLGESGPIVGALADLMLTPATSIREAIAVSPPRTLVMHLGRITHIG